jgi:D-alanyl-lipoteichoic acid acyltransferase DltB (MBOAT superfamily)
MIVGDPLYLVLLLPLALVSNLLPGGAPRAILILLCSYAYYCTFSLAHLPVLLVVTAIAFVGGLLIERFAQSRWNGWLTAATIALCLSPLVAYKYLPLLFSTSGHVAADWQLTAASLTVPIGLSFYTFAAIGYLADVALGVIAAERRPLGVALFCGFFPIVTSGPIPRTTTVLPQLAFKRRFTSERAMAAIAEILTGAVMKLWIADTLGVTSAAVFSDLTHAPPLEQFVAALFFAFQLYADFAGYSLIAIGSARLLGVDIPPNFRQPFLADSIPEFWRRWHISLLSWLRDYVYMPLYVSWRRRPRLASAAATFVTFVLVGIWHGAGWGFVVFGVVHAIIMIYAVTRTIRDGIWARLHVPDAIVRLVRVPLTFLVVALTLILIRARDMGEAIEIYRSIFSFKMIGNLANLFRLNPDTTLAFVHIVPRQLVFDFFLVVVLILGDLSARSKTFNFFELPGTVRAAYYAACILTLFYQATSANPLKPFLYLQF